MASDKNDNDTDLDARRRAILEQVADGTLSASEAAERLAAFEAEERGEPHRQDSGPTGRDSPPARTVRIEATLRGVAVIGDPAVAEAVAEGPHLARREGDVLVIESRLDRDWGSSGFAFSRVGPHGMRVRTGPGRRDLVVRINPDLALEASVDAGSLSVKGVTGSIGARVSAGAARVDGFAAPLDVEVVAGSFKGRGVLNTGDSHIRCEAGAVRLHLERGSSVAVTTESSLGKVRVGEGVGATTAGSLLSDSRSTVIGGGAGNLEIEVSMGSLRLTSDE